MAKTDVAEVKNTAVAAQTDWGDYAGVGAEDFDTKDLIVPIIGVLQSNSPDVQDCEDGSVRMGMLKNTVTGEYLDGKKGFNFIPVFYQKVWIEWQPRSEGGRLVNIHMPDSEAVADVIKNNGGSTIPVKGADGKKRPMTLPGERNEFVETHQLYVIVLTEDGTEAEGFALLNFKSTGISVIRKFMTTHQMLKGSPPLFAIRAKFFTKTEKNNDGTWALPILGPMGETFSQGLIRPSVPADKELLDSAANFRQMIVDGVAKGRGYEEDRNSGDVSTGGGASKDEDMPF